MNRPYQAESWNEYRRLVLAELDRLNECIEKLRERHDHTTEEYERALTAKIAELSKSITRQLRDAETRMKDSISDANIKSGDAITEVLRRLQKLEENSVSDYISDSKNGRLAFWTAVISIFGSLVASIISLVISIYG